MCQKRVRFFFDLNELLALASCWRRPPPNAHDMGDYGITREVVAGGGTSATGGDYSAVTTTGAAQV